MDNCIRCEENCFYTKVWGSEVRVKSLDSALFWYCLEEKMKEIEKRRK